MLKIAERSGHRLRVKSKTPIWLTAGLFTIALLWLYFLCPSYIGEVSRGEDGTADIRVRAQIFGLTLEDRTIEGVRSAFVEESSQGAQEGNTTTRLSFGTSVGRIPIRPAYTAQAGQQGEAARQVMAFLNEQGMVSARFAIAPGALVWGGFWFVAFVAAAGCLLEGGRECVIDRANRTVAVHGPKWRRTPPHERPLETVEAFGVSTITRRSDKGREIPMHTLVMRLKNGAEIPLMNGARSWGARKMAEVAGELEAFRLTVIEDAGQAESHEIASSPSKHCVLCGEYCGDAERMRDEAGRYYHAACWRSAMATIQKEQTS